MTFDHELKLGRAHKHLIDLGDEIAGWLDGDNYAVHVEYDLHATWSPAGNLNCRPAPGRPAKMPHPPGRPVRGLATVYVAVQEDPPNDIFGPLIGDTLHNLRSGLDALAYVLAVRFTGRPLPDNMAHSSEFPIFGDADRSGNTGVGSALFHQRRKNGDPAPGSGLSKIQGWDPAAQAVVEGVQPYQRGHDFVSDPLWVLHELDRINKHRLLHSVVASFEGFTFEPIKSNATFGPGSIESLAGTVEDGAPVARIYGIAAADPSIEVHVEAGTPVGIAFASDTPCVAGKDVLDSLAGIDAYISEAVAPALADYL
jgi:hypothetical protein